MTTLTAVDAAVARILLDPIRHVYALLWRVGLIEVKERSAEDHQPVQT